MHISIVQEPMGGVVVVYSASAEAESRSTSATTKSLTVGQSSRLSSSASDWVWVFAEGSAVADEESVRLGATDRGSWRLASAFCSSSLEYMMKSMD